MSFNVTIKNKYGLFNICALAQYKEHGPKISIETHNE